ncbi:MAG: sugar phosphate nucleotidyltransferase [Defluviitaleaceae bacterium]|nr:sugar phosphate nucleotidyltransferase [Defluviitaleaceae bacterium]
MQPKETTLVIMAAGMGSRYGGLKQLEAIGTNGEVFMDYAIHDAVHAGFTKAVIIIKKENEEDFKRIIGNRIENKINTTYVFQQLPSHRRKPYGTAEAILCCKDAVKTPFAVINADDFYGQEAYVKMQEHLSTSKDSAMVAYYLKNTLSDSGTVARGICTVDSKGYLQEVDEQLAIPKDNDYPDDTVVSMNFFGLHPEIFPLLEEGFEEFKKTADINKDEYLLPREIDKRIKEGKIKMKVLSSADLWHGITNPEDKDIVISAIRKIEATGRYANI